MEKIVAFHELNYKSKVQVMAEVPGVVTLMGAFSDFCDGYCIAGTGALGLRVALSWREDTTVRVYDATRGDKKHFQVGSLKYRKEDRWANCVKGVFAALAGEGHSFTRGLDITLKGALLYCDQITVTESIVLGCFMALGKALGLDFSEQDLIRRAYMVATNYCGVSVRLRDLVTLMYAQKGKVFHFDLQSVTYDIVDYPFMEPGNGPYGIILDPSLPPQILREELEEKRRDARLCCKALKKLIPEDVKLRNYPVKDLRSHIIRDLDEHARHTCQYVISETQLVEKGYSALLAGDAKLFGKYLTSTYLGMRDVFNVTCPEVDWLVRRAGETDGVHGACYVSNGDSGSIFMILEKEGEEAFASRMTEYRRIFDFTPKTRVFRPGGPARVIEDIYQQQQ